VQPSTQVLDLGARRRRVMAGQRIGVEFPDEGGEVEEPIGVGQQEQTDRGEKQGWGRKFERHAEKRSARSCEVPAGGTHRGDYDSVSGK
jgi:hypothetical protein